MKRLFGIFLAMVLMVSLAGMAFAAGPGDTSVEAPSAALDGTVYEETLANGAKAFIYVPNCSGYGVRATVAPILQVYGDKAFTAESAKATALSSGLAQIADAEQGAVIFVNPIGAVWSAADAGSYEAAKNMFSDATNNLDPAGNFTSAGKNSAGKYAGSYTRNYVFAEGSGADFVYEQLSCGVAGSGQFFGNAIYKPTAAFLMNLSSARTVDLSTGDARQIPVVLVNSTSAVTNAYKTLNGAMPTQTYSSSVHSGFDKVLLLQAYDTVLEHYMVRMQCAVGHPDCKTSLLEIQSAAAQGLVETKGSYAYRDGTALNYYMWSKGDTAGKPIFIIMHGSGSSAESIVWSGGFDTLAAADDFTLVSLENYANFTSNYTVAAKLMEGVRGIVDAARADTSRIYLGGFSLGGRHTWMLASTYSDYFAGFYCMNSFNSGMDADGFQNVMPVYASSGLQTHNNNEFPKADNYRQIEALFKADGITDNYVFDSAYTWGMAPSATRTVVDETLPDLTFTINDYASADGQVYVKLTGAALSGHEPLRTAAADAWAFLSKFSRNPDGSIAVSPRDDFRLAVDGKAVEFAYGLGTPYINGDSRTMVPLRAAAYAMGLAESDLRWDNATATASFTSGDIQVSFTEGSDICTVVKAGKTTQVQMDTGLVNYSGRVYAPIRFLAEALGYTANWDSATQTANIITK